MTCRFRTYRVPIQQEPVDHDPLDVLARCSVLLLNLLKTGLPLLKDLVLYGYVLLFVEVIV